MGKNANRNRRSRKPIAKTSLHISVANASTSRDIDLRDEIRQSQAALLYADSVTLISPRANIIHSVAAIGDAQDLEMLELLAGIAPHYAPDAAPQIQEILNAVRAAPPDRRRIGLQRLSDTLRPISIELQSRVREQLSEAAYDELKLAMRAGLLTIDILPGSDVREFEDADISERYFARVQETLTSGSTYPLFDHTTNNLVALGIEAGILSPVPAARRHGRDAALASGLFDQLPNFEYANMSEILDIRSELRDPLQRFRQGVREISKDIETVPESPEFAHEVSDAWTNCVAPALTEIENAIAENTSLRDLVRRGVNDPAGLAGIGGATGLAVAAGPASATASAAALFLSSAVATAGLGVAAVRANMAQRAATREATEAQFYFLYGANSRMGTN